eukprot:37145-Alexandrium_andersonii.AAC.1
MPKRGIPRIPQMPKCGIPRIPLRRRAAPAAHGPGGEGDGGGGDGKRDRSKWHGHERTWHVYACKW